MKAKTTKYQSLPKLVDKPTETRGRPKGSGAGTSPDAVPVTLRISRDVYRRAQIAVIQADDGRPLSKVVEDLLAVWLSEQESPIPLHK